MLFEGRNSLDGVFEESNQIVQNSTDKYNKESDPWLPRTAPNTHLQAAISARSPTKITLLILVSKIYWELGKYWRNHENVTPTSQSPLLTQEIEHNATSLDHRKKGPPRKREKNHFH